MRTLRLLSIFVLISVSTGAGAQNTSMAQPTPVFTNLPLSFEQNIGQTSGDVQFIGRARGYTLFLSSNQAVFELQTVSAPPEDRAAEKKLGKQYIVQRARKSTRKIELVRMRLIGANPGVHLDGVNPLGGTVNYFIGSDPGKWRRGVPLFEKVQSSKILPGVDVIYYGNEKQLEYDFVVKPGADPNAISLGFEGAQSSSIDSAGNLAMSTATSLITLHQPLIYQVVSGQRKLVRGQYAQRGANAIGINVEAYDRSLPLVIDPVLSYSTYLGGSGVDGIGGVAVDSSGNAYVTGWTTSSNFPIVGTSLTPAPTGNQVAFVSKFNSTGTALIYSTYLGGSGGDSGNGIALDSNGSAYVVGDTGSTNFPTTSNAYQAQFHTGAIENAFVSKLSANGQSLLYSTYLGGGTDDLGFDIAVDANQNAYITGVTTSGSPAPFPTTAGALETSLRSTAGDGFVSRIDTTQSGASSLVYFTFLGGSGTGGDNTSGIAVDANHNAYVGGQTCSNDFPLTSTAYQTVINTSGTGFLTRIDTTKSGSAGLIYSTVIEGVWQGHGVALDSLGKTYVTGGEYGFPAYVAKFDTSKSGSASFLYLTAIGGSNGDAFSYSVAVDGNGDAYAGGWTAATNLPVTSDAIQSTLGSGGQDSYVTVLSPNGSTVLFGTYIGGNGGSNDFALQVALDHSDNIYVGGSTGSANFKTTTGAFQTSIKGTSDGFLSKFSPLSQPIINSANSTVFLIGTANSFTVTATGTPAPTLTESGTLPRGVTFTPSTGLLSGTPMAGTAGTYSLTFTASNGVTPNATQTFTLTVVTPPSISAVVSPAPNAAGWSNLNTTVTFTCMAGTYPIASCPSPQTLTFEGRGQIVSGTAVDTHGFTATTSVTINLDKTPPVLTVTGPSDGTTESSSPVSVSGTLSDSLSGVSGVTCDGVAASLSGGSFSCNVNLNVGNNLVVVRGTDVAGNVAADNFHLTLSGSLSTPSSLQVTPTGVNLVVGGTQQFTAVDNLGRPRSDATWTVSNSSVATINGSSSPTVTAVAVGTATLTATVGTLTAQAAVNVLSGTSLSSGTQLWSASTPSGYFAEQIVQAQVLPFPGTPELFSVQRDSTVQHAVISALTADGRQLWTSGALSGRSIRGVPDGNGGILAIIYPVSGSTSSIVDIDAQTGSPVWQYNSTGSISQFAVQRLAVAADGTVYFSEYTNSHGSLVELDGLTGAVRARYAVPNGTDTIIDDGTCGYTGATQTFVDPYASVSDPVIGPDGTILAAQSIYSYTKTYGCTIRLTNDQQISLVKMAPDGTATVTLVKDDTTLHTQSPGDGVDEVIPDPSGGALVAWEYDYPPAGSQQSYHVTDVTSSGLNDFTIPIYPYGMVVGDNNTLFIASGNQALAYQLPGGSQLWSYSAPSNQDSLTSIDAVDGGGLVAKITDATGKVDTVVRFSANGVAALDSWTGAGLDYYVGNIWTGFTSGSNSTFAYSAAPIDLSSGEFISPQNEGTSRGRQDFVVSGFSQSGPNQAAIVGVVKEILAAVPLTSFPGSSSCNFWVQTGQYGTGMLAQLQKDLANGTWAHGTIKYNNSIDWQHPGISFLTPNNPDGSATNVPLGVFTVINDPNGFFQSNFPKFQSNGGTILIGTTDWPTATQPPPYSGNTIQAQAQIALHEMGHVYEISEITNDYDRPAIGQHNDWVVDKYCGVMIRSLPGVASLSPTSGKVGASVTITGVNFGSSRGASTVTFNGSPAPVTAQVTSWEVVATVLS